MKRWVIFGLTISLIGAFTWVVAPAKAPDIPLPADIKILPPGPDVPSRAAKFSGAWKGQWVVQGGGGSHDGILIVEEIHPSTAKCIRAVSGHFFGRIYIEKEYERIEAKIENEKLILDTKSHLGLIIYVYNETTDTLNGSYEVGRLLAIGTFHRVPLGSLISN